MLAGFVDRRGRKYDVNFRTLRVRLLDEAGRVVTAEGEAIEVQTTCEAEATIRFGDRSVQFLLRAPGELTRTSARYVYVVAEDAPRPPDVPSLLNVKLPLHPSAIASFFREQVGREYLEFTPGDVVAAREGRRGVEVEIGGPSPGRVGEKARYVATFTPASNVREALEGLL